MRENYIMKWITFAGIGIFIYLYLRFRNSGTIAQVSACNVPVIVPNTTICNVPFVSDNPAIPLAAHYLPCNSGFSAYQLNLSIIAQPYRPAVSKIIVPRVRSQAPIAKQAAKNQYTATPMGVPQCLPPPLYAPAVCISTAVPCKPSQICCNASCCCGYTKGTCGYTGLQGCSNVDFANCSF
jgi:hypothetical protein